MALTPTTTPNEAIAKSRRRVLACVCSIVLSDTWIHSNPESDFDRSKPVNDKDKIEISSQIKEQLKVDGP